MRIISEIHTHIHGESSSELNYSMYEKEIGCPQLGLFLEYKYMHIYFVIIKRSNINKEYLF